MQLRRPAVAAAVALLTTGLGAASALAEPLVSVDGRTSYYADDDATQISTTVVGVTGNPTDKLSVNGHYLADIVTTASVDVRTQASPRTREAGWQETRHEGAGGVSYHDGTNTLAAGYVYSVEHDWRSNTGSLSGSRDFLQHQLTLGLGGSVTINDVGMAESPSFSKDCNQGSLGLDATVVPTKHDIVGLNYTLVYIKGYQSSPYRNAFFELSDGVVTASPEVAPDVRVRHAVGARWNHHMFHDTVVRSHLRGYADDWGILSITGGAEYVVGFGKLEGGAFVRGYAQKGVTFWQDVYSERRRYMTSDRELSPFIDAFGGLRLTFNSGRLGPLENLHAEVRGTVFTFKFSDFARLPTRQGIIGDLGLGASF